MNDPMLEDDLARLLFVDDARLAHIRERVLARSRTPRRPPRRPRRRALAASVVVGAFVLVGVALHSLDTGERPAAPPDHGLLVIERTDGRRAVSHYEPPPLGLAVAESDWVVLGRVEGLTEAEVTFRIREVLQGALPRGGLRLSRAFDEMHVSCHEDVTWHEGEELVLALFRDPEDGHLKVRHGGSGQGRFPLQGVVTLGDLRDVMAEGRLAPERLAAQIAAHGPGVIRTYRWHLHDLCGPLPVDDPLVQDALERQLVVPPEEDEDGWQRLLGAAHRLSPERLRAAARPMLDDLVPVVRRRVAEASSPHSRVARIAPWARAGFAFAHPVVAGEIAEAEARAAAKPHAYGWRRLLLELYELLHVHDPADAVERTWALYRERPERGQVDAGEVLERLLAWDRERATEELLRRTREARRTDGFVWTDLLFTSRDPRVAALLRELLADPDFSLGPNRYQHSPLKALRRRGRAARLDPLRDLLVARLRSTAGSLRRYHDWLDLYLLRFDDVAPFAPALAARLEAVERLDFATRRFVGAVEQTLAGRFLRYRHPTEEELLAAARAMADALRPR